MFPLANALVPEAKIHIKGKGDMKIPIRYENIPFFCFICGRMGHSDKECPDGEMGDGAFSYGVELRAAPPKRLREVKVQTRSVAARFLNFEGRQRVKLQDEVSSSLKGGNPRARTGLRQIEEEQKEEGDQANSILHEEEQELMRGMKDIDVTEVGSQDKLLPVYGPDGM
jgi:hypothetical protein